MDYIIFKNLIDWFELQEKVYQKFEDLFKNIFEQNKITNTTRILEKKNFFIKNIFDSLLITKIFPELLNQSYDIADVGCGGGFPSIPLAIINKKLNIIGIDSNNKKAKAVNLSAKNLNLNNLSTEHIRAREAGRKKNFKFDFVMIRAVAEVSILIRECRQLLKTNGKLVLFKTLQGLEKEKNILREIKNYKFNYKISSSFQLPHNTGERIFMILSKKNEL